MDAVNGRACGAVIHYAAVSLAMPIRTRATALVFFHRYYAQRRADGPEQDSAVGESNRAQLVPTEGRVRQLVVARREPEYSFVVASACLFLASKCSVEEAPVTLGSIVTAMYAVRHPEDECLRISGFYWRRKDEVILAEHDVLRTLRFDVGVTLAFDHLLAYLRLLSVDQRFTSLAITACSDCYRLADCLRFSPSAVACGAILITADALHISLPMSFEIPWFVAMGTTAADVESVRSCLLKAYKQLPITREELQEELAQPSLGAGHNSLAESEVLHSG